MFKNIFCLLLTIMLFVLVACSSSQPKARPEGSGIGVVVTVKQPGIALPEGSTFSWMEDASMVYQDPRLDSIKIRELLKDAITKELEKRGYQVVSQGGTYDIAFVAALRESLSDIELSERFGINPGMVGDSRDEKAYDKATVIADIRQAADDHLVWRSALQGFAVFDLDDAERKARLDRAVKRLFATLP